MNRIPTLISLSAAVILSACGSETAPDDAGAAPPPAGEVNVYSSRHYISDDALYAAFEAETGVKVRAREANAAQLVEIMKAEGASSPADLVITADAGSLWRFQSEGLLQPASSPAIKAAIPAQYREPEDYWTGLSKRLRVIVYDPQRLDPEQVDDYADLAAPEMAGEVCARSSTNVYNLSLMGDLMERWGADEAADWAAKVSANFARDPEGGDTSQIEAVAAGLCSAAIANHYYWVRMTEKDGTAQQAAAAKTRISFPSTAGKGVHLNLTGAGVAAHAPNRDNAIKLLEFLASRQGQELLVVETKEFPIVADAALPSGLDGLTGFEPGDTPLTAYGENQAAAQAAFDRVGWR